MKLPRVRLWGVAFMALVIPISGRGQTLTDVGTSAPTGSTYSQPEHAPGSSPSAVDGEGEEFTLSSSDTTLELTDLVLKSSGDQNSDGSSGSLDWTLNLYDLTGNHEQTLTFSGVSVATGDYLDFALSPPESAQTLLVGGHTYAFTVTTNAQFYLGGLYKSQETPSNYLPSGITAEAFVTGNGTGSSLTVYDDPTNGEGDLTYYLKTEATPEPQPTALLLGTFFVWGLLSFRRLAQRF